MDGREWIIQHTVQFVAVFMLLGILIIVLELRRIGKRRSDD